MKKIMDVHEDYRKNIRQYTKKDGMMALLLWGIMCLSYCILALRDLNSGEGGGYFWIIGLFNTCLIVIVLLFVKRKKQKLNSVGLYGGRWKAGCIMGGILAAVVFMMNCGQYLMQGRELIPAAQIAELSVSYLLVAVCEELFFRGYIATRIQGLIKSAWAAVVVTGILFVLMHFPYRMIAYGMSIQDLTINNIGWVIDLFVSHIIWNFIYSKTNSLYGAILPHWISNFAYQIVLR